MSSPSFPRTIAVEGVIGAGKTTLATALAARLDAQLVFERFEENPFLESFYRDPERYAFQTQIYFLLGRYRQQQELAQIDLFHYHLVSDYAFDKDRIFATLTLGDQELALYDTVAGALGDTIPRPDLVIYLRSSIERLMGNIARRGRRMERSIEREYLERLSDAYDSHFADYTAGPLLVLDMDRLDIVERPEDLQSVLDAVLSSPRSGIRLLPEVPLSIGEERADRDDGSHPIREQG